MISAGTYKAKADGQCVLGMSANKGTPFLEFYLRIVGGEFNGQAARWTGYFTEKTSERSIQSLQTCGWDGDDISEFSDGQLHGLDSNEVEIVVEIESYEKDGETKKAARVAWINRAGGWLNTDAAMNQEKASEFGERMKGLVRAMKEKRPVTKDSGTDFPHGANAPPAPEPTTGTQKKAF